MAAPKSLDFGIAGFPHSTRPSAFTLFRPRMVACLFLALTFVVSFAASVLFTAVVRVVARRWGVVDRPDGLRKLHKGPVPLWGGVAVYLACLLGMLFARCGSFGIGERLDELAIAVAAAAGLACLAGCIDDACQLRSGVKLGFQVAPCCPS